MDPIELLTRQHEEAETLFQQVSVARGEERTRLFRRLAWLLTLHAQLEEPALVRLRASVEAHVAEERSMLFPQVRRLFSAEQLERLGEELVREMDDLMQPGALPSVSPEPLVGAP
jgi:hypothetical protein